MNSQELVLVISMGSGRSLAERKRGLRNTATDITVLMINSNRLWSI